MNSTELHMIRCQPHSLPSLISVLIPDGDPKNRSSTREMKSKDGSHGGKLRLPQFSAHQRSAVPGLQWQEQQVSTLGHRLSHVSDTYCGPCEKHLISLTAAGRGTSPYNVQDGRKAQRKNSSCPESHSKGRGGSKPSPTSFCTPDASLLLSVVGGTAADLMDGKM